MTPNLPSQEQIGLWAKHEPYGSTRQLMESLQARTLALMSWYWRRTKRWETDEYKAVARDAATWESCAAYKDGDSIYYQTDRDGGIKITATPEVESFCVDCWQMIRAIEAARNPGEMERGKR